MTDEPPSLALALQLVELQDSPQARRWIAGGLRAWLETGGEVPLEYFLGLRRPDRLQWRRWRQRHLLARAARLLGHEASSWAGAVALAGEVATFETRIWPRWRQLAQPPAGASDLRATLDAVFRIGLPVARSPRGLLRLLTVTPPATVSGAGDTVAP